MIHISFGCKDKHFFTNHEKRQFCFFLGTLNKKAGVAVVMFIRSCWSAFKCSCGKIDEQFRCCPYFLVSLLTIHELFNMVLLGSYFKSWKSRQEQKQYEQLCVTFHNKQKSKNNWNVSCCKVWYGLENTPRLKDQLLRSYGLNHFK